MKLLIAQCFQLITQFSPATCRLRAFFSIFFYFSLLFVVLAMHVITTLNGFDYLFDGFWISRWVKMYWAIRWRALVTSVELLLTYPLEFRCSSTTWSYSFNATNHLTFVSIWTTPVISRLSHSHTLSLSIFNTRVTRTKVGVYPQRKPSWGLIRGSFWVSLTRSQVCAPAKIQVVI